MRNCPECDKKALVLHKKYDDHEGCTWHGPTFAGYEVICIGCGWSVTLNLTTVESIVEDHAVDFIYDYGSKD